MTQSQETVLTLLNSAISGKRGSVSSDTNWEEVIDIATNQGVLAVCFDALEALKKPVSDGSFSRKLSESEQSSSVKVSNVSGSFPDMDSLMEWLGQTSYQESQYEQNWEVACELDKLWASAGITATVLKGRSFAQYYPKPNHRYSCDLDVFIPEGGVNGWEKACEVLKEKGIELEYEVYKEVEFTYKDTSSSLSTGVYVECHRYITPVRGNDNLLKFERYLRSLLECEPTICFKGTSLVNPPLKFTALLYVEHALGDFLKGPLTLKHVTDWLVLRRRVPEVSGGFRKFQRACEEFGFDRFLRLVDTMADVVEGKVKYEELSTSYKRAFNEIFDGHKTSTSNKSFTERRVNQFFDVLKCRWKFKEFGYISMPSYLKNVLWAHWFDKEVKL